MYLYYITFRGEKTTFQLDFLKPLSAMNGYTSTTWKHNQEKMSYQFQIIYFAYIFSKLHFRNKYSGSINLASKYVKILIVKVIKN